MRGLRELWDPDRQRGYLFPWSAVLFGAGIGIYFGLRREPSAAEWAALAALAAGAAALLRVAGDRIQLVLIAALLVLAGLGAAGFRAQSVAGVVLAYRYYGPVEGRIVAIDRSASDAVRLTLDRVVIPGFQPGETPGRVRISLHSDIPGTRPEPGLTVMATAHLSPPGGAVEPGGFDFRRQAWFGRLGAVGYTRVPLMALRPHEGHEAGLWLYRLRMRVTGFVHEALPGRVGAFAAAITTGDRSGMDRPTLDALRASNLAHLLAISGLHMGLLTGFVFAAVRVVLAVPARTSLALPSKKIAAVVALVAGAAYLALSGGNVATERAFIMVAVMFGAVLADRRAVTMRAVALAALIVLALRPEALYGPGFQMSFAATTALVFVFGRMTEHDRDWPRWARMLGGVTLSSFVAGMATAPIAAAHFNQVPHYGLIANVVSVPLMGALIIPGAVLAALLAPVGLAWIGLWLMKWPILWILWVAETVAGWPGALSFVVAPPPAVLPLLAAGALAVVLWQGRGRLAGLPVMALAFALWAGAERPEVLVAESGGLIGVMTEVGRALSKPKGDGFAAESWLENDGDPAAQAAAFDRPAFAVEGRERVVTINGAVILHATGKVAAKAALERCGEAALVIVNVSARAPAGCAVYDLRRLSKTGALAIRAEGAELKVVTAAERAGRRPWSP